MSTAEFVDGLNHEYERLHIAKEDAFWTAYMGLSDDADAARATLDERDKALNAFMQDPAQLAAVRERQDPSEGEDMKVALSGWERTFAANVIDTEEGRALGGSIIDMEGALARARNDMELGYTVDGEFTPANSIKLGTMITAEPDAAKRRAAWEGLQAIEPFVLENGFLELVRARNKLGRMMGAEDYYDWRVRRTEGLSKRQIFDLLDELEVKTRDSGAASLERLRAEKGDDAAAPWNMRFLTAGDVTVEQDPHFPFADAFERWGRTFAALGIDYNGAEMVLDLVDRKGKFENGFMHGPVPAWRDHGEYRTARIQFTANAIPGMVGSGRRATDTLFHEGGHAAHFANIDMPAPCFSQEFAPTSVAFAELQSMFCDSLVDDPDWQTRYAGMPMALIEKSVRAMQPYAAHMLRQGFTIPYCERAIYEIPDEELTKDRVMEEIEAVEQRILGMDRSPRPALSVPHLLAGEGSAYYHGYMMALVAVAQTREFFLQRDGHLVDNPAIGPAFRDIYWKPGNSRTFFQFVETMTGRPLAADDIARVLNRSVDEAIEDARRRVAHLPQIPEFAGPVQLNARIKVMHGNETVAECNGDFDQACAAFSHWISELS